MSADLKKAMNKLISDWSKAPSKWKGLMKASGEIKGVLYSHLYLFKLSEYVKRGWKDEEYLTGSPPEKFRYYEYGFNEENIPLQIRIWVEGSVTNTGFFVWGKDKWEYIEFRRDGVCSAYECIQIKNGIIEQSGSLGLNGHYPIVGHSAKEREAILVNNSNSYFAEVYRYHWNDGVITHADCLSNFPGSGRRFTVDQFFYGADNELERIVTNDKDASSLVTYKKLGKRSEKSLIASIAKQLATEIIVDISKSGYREKLSGIELNFQYCYQYWPLVIFIPENDMEDAKKSGIYPSSFIKCTSLEKSSLSLQDEMAELLGLMAKKDDYKIGVRMLIETAKIIYKNRAGGVLPVTDDFFVFPIDWTLHEDPSTKLLEDCGMPREQIGQWLELQWAAEPY